MNLTREIISASVIIVALVLGRLLFVLVHHLEEELKAYDIAQKRTEKKGKELFARLRSRRVSV